MYFIYYYFVDCCFSIRSRVVHIFSLLPPPHHNNKHMSMRVHLFMLDGKYPHSPAEFYSNVAPHVPQPNCFDKYTLAVIYIDSPSSYWSLFPALVCLRLYVCVSVCTAFERCIMPWQTHIFTSSIKTKWIYSPYSSLPPILIIYMLSMGAIVYVYTIQPHPKIEEKPWKAIEKLSWNWSDEPETSAFAPSVTYDTYYRHCVSALTYYAA